MCILDFMENRTIFFKFVSIAYANVITSDYVLLTRQSFCLFFRFRGLVQPLWCLQNYDLFFSISYFVIIIDNVGRMVYVVNERLLMSTRDIRIS